MQMLRLQREEYALGIITFVVLLFFHTLIIAKFWPLFSQFDSQTWTSFLRNYHMSGFDPITYDVVTQWDIGYAALRHPLLPWLVYPLYLLNQLLWQVTGANCVQFVVGVPLFFCGFYSILFLYRILRQIIGVGCYGAYLLTLFFLFFAHVLVAMIVPDHFCISLFLLLLTFYIAGKKIQHSTIFSPSLALSLFVITAGVTLSNGVLTLLAVMLTNRRSFFTWQYLLPLGVASLFLVGLGFMFNALGVVESGAEMQGWLAGETLRWDVMVENFWGESIQLHRQHILGDVLVRRPVIVRYTWWAQYLVEALLVLFTFVGLWLGRRQRMAWLMGGSLTFAFVLHILLGFAYNEVHIMACHWVYAVPCLMAYLLITPKKCINQCFYFLISLLTLYLVAYHSTLLYNYLTWPLHLN